MRLKSLYTPVTNQRIKTTCVANIFMLCLLTSSVWSFANIKHNRFVRQLNDEMAVNYEDFSTTTNPYHQPHFTGNRSVVVQLFEWKFVDIAAECRDFLGPQGYAGVQISPVLEHTVVQTDELNHPWWERYEVVSYRLASRSGDESEFWSMSRICNEHGVRIYADVVLNNMAAPLHFMGVGGEENKDFIVNTLLEENVNLTQLNYSKVSYTLNDFHKPYCQILASSQDAHVIRNCQWNGHPDLYHARGNVQKHIVQMLNKFIDMGVAGFRIDSAKYMWPIDLKNILNQLKNLSTEFKFKKNTRPFAYHDVFDLGLDTTSKTEYSSYGVVSEYLYPAELSTILRGKIPLSSLINWGPAMGFMSHEDSLVFIDSHDTQRGLPWQLGNNQMLSYKQRIKYIMANVFMLVHPYGAIKRIMSSYYFPDTEINQGPPVEESNEEEIRSPKFNEQQQCTKESGWVCEHRWPEIVNLIKVANYFKAPGNKEESINYFQTNGPNQVAFCRGQKAFVAINTDAEKDFIKEVYACLEPGSYCDMVTGGKKEGEEECQGKILEINEQGYTKLELSVADDMQGYDEEGTEAEEVEEGEEEFDKIKSYGIIVIYVESKIKTANEHDGEEKTHEMEDKQAEAEEEDVEEGEESQVAEDGQGVEGEANETEQEQQTDKEENVEETAEKQEDVEEEGEADEEEQTGAEEAEERQLAEDGQTVKEDANETDQEQQNDEEENVEEAAEEQEKVEEKGETEERAVSANEEEQKENLDNEENEEEQSSKEVEEDAEVEAGEEDDKDEVKSPDKEKEETNKEDSVPKNEQELVDTSAEVAVETDEEDTEKDLDESDKEPEAASDTGNNQSRNLDERSAGVAEEQIEKPSAEIVNEVADLSDTVTAKIQDVQKAGVFPNLQGGGSNG